MPLLSSMDQTSKDEPFTSHESLGQASHDPRALRILAKTVYRELRQSGLAEEDVMAFAGELLSLVAIEVKGRRRNDEVQTEGAKALSGSR